MKSKSNIKIGDSIFYNTQESNMVFKGIVTHIIPCNYDNKTWLFFHIINDMTNQKYLIEYDFIIQNSNSNVLLIEIIEPASNFILEEPIVCSNLFPFNIVII